MSDKTNHDDDASWRTIPIPFMHGTDVARETTSGGDAARLVDPVRREALDQAVRHAGFFAQSAMDVVGTATKFYEFLSKDTSNDD